MNLTQQEIIEELERLEREQFQPPPLAFSAENYADSAGVSLRTAQRRIRSGIRKGRIRFRGKFSTGQGVDGRVVWAPFYERVETG